MSMRNPRRSALYRLWRWIVTGQNQTAIDEMYERMEAREQHYIWYKLRESKGLGKLATSEMFKRAKDVETAALVKQAEGLRLTPVL